MMGIIYKITNTVNEKTYIGQTIRDLSERWYQHHYDALVGKCKTKLGRAIRKYGKDAFRSEIIESTNSLDERERYFIAFFNSITNGYNIKIGGNGGPHNKSTKIKISKANTKRVWTSNMRENMSIAIKKWHKKRGFVPRSEDCKRKISEANRNRKMPQLAKFAFQKYNKKMSKPVICLNTGKEYASINEACKNLNLNNGHLRMHLKGKYSHVKGFSFKFK